MKKEEENLSLAEALDTLTRTHLSYLRMGATLVDVIRAEGVVYSLGGQAGDIMIAKNEARKLYDENK
jgi:hypothetical protein